MKSYISKNGITIYHGCALEVLKEMDNGSVDMVMTSPPYWNLRDYGHNGQLGLEPTYQEYINKLVSIFDEVKRVLKDTGTCWVVLGDTYGGSGGAGGDYNEGGLKEGQPRYKGNNMIPKSLIGIPERFAIAMQDRGWIRRNTIIWYKSNCMPSSANDRFTVDFEYLYFFTKKPQYYFEQQFEPTFTKDNIVRDRDTTKLNNTPGRSRMAGLKTNDYDNRNKRCVWSISTESFAEAHFATFPQELCRVPILASCPGHICKITKTCKKCGKEQ